MTNAWFDNALEQHLEDLFENRITINKFKCFFYPNAWFLELPENHKALTIKLALAEHGAISDEEAIGVIKKALTQ